MCHSHCSSYPSAVSVAAEDSLSKISALIPLIVLPRNLRICLIVALAISMSVTNRGLVVMPFTALPYDSNVFVTIGAMSVADVARVSIERSWIMGMS